MEFTVEVNNFPASLPTQVLAEPPAALAALPASFPIKTEPVDLTRLYPACVPIQTT